MWMPHGDHLVTKHRAQQWLSSANERGWMEGALRVSPTLYVASIGGGGPTLRETVIIVSNHLLEDSTDHFAATQKRRLLIHGNVWFPNQIGNATKSSVL